jgi:hypothetical protein
MSTAALRCAASKFIVDGIEPFCNPAAIAKCRVARNSVKDQSAFA